jgi:hypothetical protein
MMIIVIQSPLPNSVCIAAHAESIWLGSVFSATLASILGSFLLPFFFSSRMNWKEKCWWTQLLCWSWSTWLPIASHRRTEESTAIIHYLVFSIEMGFRISFCCWVSFQEFHLVYAVVADLVTVWAIQPSVLACTNILVNFITPVSSSINHFLHFYWQLTSSNVGWIQIPLCTVCTWFDFSHKRLKMFHFSNCRTEVAIHTILSTWMFLHLRVWAEHHRPPSLLETNTQWRFRT